MCGIVGYIGPQEATPIVLDGLRKLEYRGYDSAGIATLDQGKINISRAEGKLINLEKKLHEKPLTGQTGIGHTRWATHGRPSEVNAHPHNAGGFVVVNLDAIHADVAFAGVGVFGNDAGEGDETSTVERPAFEDGEIEEG